MANYRAGAAAFYWWAAVLLVLRLLISARRLAVSPQKRRAHEAAPGHFRSGPLGESAQMAVPVQGPVKGSALYRGDGKLIRHVLRCGEWGITSAGLVGRISGLLDNRDLGVPRCKAKRQYLLTWKVSRYCVFALHGTVCFCSCRAELAEPPPLTYFRNSVESLIFSS